MVQHLMRSPLYSEGGVDWTHDRGILSSYQVLHYLEAASHGLAECLNRLLEVQLKCQLGGNILKEWGTIIQDSVFVKSEIPYDILHPAPPPRKV